MLIEQLTGMTVESEFLRQLDPARGNELLVTALDRIEQHWTWEELALAGLVAEGSDAATWAALVRAAREGH